MEEKIQRNERRTKTGVVVSNKMNKTCVVSVVSSVKHPLYKKVVKITKKFKVHDEKGEASVGDVVTIMETRHYSKDKYFRLLEIVEKAK